MPSGQRWYCPRPGTSVTPSLEALLVHVLSCARGYMVWMCEVLELPEPGLRPAPSLESVEAEAEGYVEHVVERWRLPLAELTEEQAYDPAYETRWGVAYCNRLDARARDDAPSASSLSARRADRQGTAGSESARALMLAWIVQ